MINADVSLQQIWALRTFKLGCISNNHPNIYLMWHSFKMCLTNTTKIESLTTKKNGGNFVIISFFSTQTHILIKLAVYQFKVKHPNSQIRLGSLRLRIQSGYGETKFRFWNRELILELHSCSIRLIHSNLSLFLSFSRSLPIPEFYT